MNDDELNKFFDVDERREEARLNFLAEIYIETVSQEPGDATPAKLLSCEAVDLSANGLQVMVDEPLQRGAIHTLIIDMDEPAVVYRLTAEVRWVKSHPEGYLTGLQLYDSEGTEIIDWKFMISRCLN